MSISPAGWKGLARSAATPRNIFACLVAIACLALVGAELSDLDLRNVGASIATVTPVQWLGATLATLLSFAVVGQYDALFHRWLKTGVSAQRAMVSGAATVAIAQTVGMGLASGTLARWRSFADLSLPDAFRVTNYVSFSFMAALGLISAVALMVVPIGGHGGTVAFAALAALATLLAAVLSLLQPAWLPVALPPFRLMARLTDLAALDVGLAATVLWVLFPDALGIEFTFFFAAFVMALGAGLLSGAPGGVGPFELCLITLLPAVPEPDLVAAIVGFRLVYYALPACLAILLLARPSVEGVVCRPAPVPPKPRIRRAEAAGLSTQPGHGILSTEDVALHVAVASQTLVGVGDPASGGVYRGYDIARLDHAAKTQYLWPALYKVTARSALAARRHGWQVLAISEEAWLTPHDFSTAGAARRQLRRKLKQAAKAGVSVEQAADRLPIQAMAHIAADWAERSGGERGFTMGRFSPQAVARQSCFLGRHDGKLVAFATFHATPDEWALDLMRSASTMPDGTMHLLIEAALAAAAAEGVPRLSLAAMPREKMPGWLARLPGCCPESGLRRFKLSFAPRRTPLYLAAPNTGLLLLSGADLLLRIRRPERGAVDIYRGDAERVARRAEGNPDMKAVSTSHVERQNLTMRQFTRLTNGFSKKLVNRLHMLSLYFLHYNFVRQHKTLRMSPAMAAGVSDTLHDMEWIVALIDARAPAPKKRGPYKKRSSN